MWAALAIIAFLAGQAYLLHSLYRADRFLARQEELPEKEILSIAFAEPDTAERLAPMLADFSCAYPEIEMVLHTDPAVPEAVQEGRAAVGFLPLERSAGHGLGGLVLREAGQRVIWKTGVPAACAEAFVQYLRGRVEISGKL